MYEQGMLVQQNSNSMQSVRSAGHLARVAVGGLEVSMTFTIVTI